MKRETIYGIGLMITILFMIGTGCYAGYKEGEKGAIKEGFYYSNENGEIIAYPVSKFEILPLEKPAYMLADELQQLDKDMSDDDALTVAMYLQGKDTIISDPIERYKALIDSLSDSNQ